MWFGAVVATYEWPELQGVRLSMEQRGIKAKRAKQVKKAKRLRAAKKLEKKTTLLTPRFPA